MAKFSGYLEYDPTLEEIQSDFWTSGKISTRLYYPLHLDSVSLNLNGNYSSFQDLVLNTECGTITIKLGVDIGKGLVVDEFNVIINHHRPEINYTCIPFMPISHSLSTHLVCNDIEDILCMPSESVNQDPPRHSFTGCGSSTMDCQIGHDPESRLAGTSCC